MIDGEKEILPILTFDAQTGWPDVLRLSQPELDSKGFDRLQTALVTTVKSVVIERHYIDKDYRDTFSHFHSKRFSTPSSRCLRLHFFDELVTRESLKSFDKVAKHYLGYSIIRPTKPNCIGRTFLTAHSRNTITGTMSLCNERVSIQGTDIEIEGFPFISQDADVTVCAQSALWMLLRYFSNRYPFYPEIYPVQIGNLTTDYSLGRIYPTPGLYVWQMAEALRRLRFAPLIYSRQNFPDNFEHLLYSYIESGIPVLIAFDKHVVVGFGHKSDYSAAPVGSGGFIFSSSFNRSFVVNDDNGVPYQLLHEKKIGAPGESKFEFKDIRSFVVPLAERIFLPAESFQTVVTAILNRQDTGYKTLSPTLAASPLVLRLFLTTGKSYKRRLAERGMGSTTVEAIYRNLPLPHFIWICEISHESLFSKHEIWGEILWDATRNAYEPDGWIALHYPEMLIVDVGSALNRRQNFLTFSLQKPGAYSVYRSNLKEVRP